MADLAALFRLRPDRAADYLLAKGLKLSGPYWELDGPAHSQVFTVANLAKLDVLADIKGALQTAIDSGQTEKWFKDQLVETLKAKGWWGPAVRVDPDTMEARLVKQGSLRRLQTIYRTNLQSAYMAGRHRQALEQADRAPWAQYLAVMDSRTRPAHAALNGKVFRLDSAAWGVIAPGNGYNCRCRARYLSDRELADRGLAPAADVHILEREPPGRRPVDPLTGETPARWVQRGVSVADPTREGGRAVLYADPGWDHIPGSDGAERALAERVLARAGAIGPRTAAEVERRLLPVAAVTVPAALDQAAIPTPRRYPEADAARAFYAAAIGDRRTDRKMPLGRLTNRAAVEQALGRAVTVDEVVSQASYLHHVEDFHGISGIRKDRHPVVPEDLALAVAVINADPHPVFMGRVSHAGNPLVKFTHVINGVTYKVIGEVRAGKKNRNIAVFNLYKR